jgi:hypothetical protein
MQRFLEKLNKFNQYLIYISGDSHKLLDHDEAIETLNQAKIRFLLTEKSEVECQDCHFGL